nr:3-oxoacyl-[acyl-carrier-protein] synthase III C-terminal domain-containing protein [Prosthecobacter debontii]
MAARLHPHLLRRARPIHVHLLGQCRSHSAAQPSAPLSPFFPGGLDEAHRQGKIKKGDIVLLVAFGGGFTWASSVLRW